VSRFSVCVRLVVRSPWATAPNYAPRGVGRFVHVCCDPFHRIVCSLAETSPYLPPGGVSLPQSTEPTDTRTADPIFAKRFSSCR